MERFVYRVRAADTLAAIARQFEVRPGEIIRHNALSAPEVYEGMRLLIVRVSGERYQVKPFENAAVIAKKFGTTKAELLSKNGLPENGDVFLGQVIYVPA